MCTHFLQQWFNLSARATEEALYNMALFLEFMSLNVGKGNLLLFRFLSSACAAKLSL
ncbi:hypothetical protein GCM10027082_38510 [Comamonas humi]